MAALPVSDIRLTNRRSFPAWYAELKINSTFRNVWHLVNPDTPEAPHLLSADPPPPLTIDQMIEQSNIERNTSLAIWDADGRPEAEKGARLRAPRPARFDDIKEEYSFRLKDSRYQNIWDWVRRTVEPALLVPHLELLVSQQRLSLQNVDYNRILDRGRIGRESPIAWINDWYQALVRAQTYRVAEVEGFLAIKDFLQVQLALVIEANALGEIFEALIQQNERSSLAIFASLAGRSDSQGHSYPCKETRAEKHPWKPVNCSILELATTGSCTRKLDLQPTDEQLKAVRERLAKGYEKLSRQLEKKGWMKNGGKLPGDFEC
ncbi:uncharacterized protein K444DRAFT_606094 [Hyaloscypha bicolor E]|uniref:Uncharacterized protein n=1 Tax=Hyaloscypha bicolor E TaxID=1095630 RepID=A0A2J6TVY3_9HELO|nr:uncharacterized protein K444DRAFT_606094 [Hyaloscypha bicolor E]PMD67167.1 hypothetical protein K444DRAFT_606094 [Hyaloscypha bicolor E]